MTGGMDYMESQEPNFRDTCGKCGARRIDQQIGLEPTPAAYLERMVAVFREVRRVLRSDGVCFVNMGDGYNAYNGNRGASRSISANTEDAMPDLPGGYGLTTDTLKPKDLIGMPWRLAFALQADGWWLRSDIIWAKPNPMPESVTDRPTKAHEYIFMLTKAARYYWDAEGVKQETVRPNESGTIGGTKSASSNSPAGDDPSYRQWGRTINTTLRCNLRTVWQIATQPWPESHFATFPEEIPSRCIKAGTSERGCCPACGGPWERQLERYRNGRDWNANNRAGGDRLGVGQSASDGMPDDYRAPQTIGWSPTCRCPAHEPVPQTVLDPFLGSGTTLAVAVRLGRRGVGIELNEEYAAMAERRIGEAAKPATFRRPDAVDSPLFALAAPAPGG